MENKVFYLTGFMGAGKSTIGPILAETLGWDYYDLDEIIEEKLGMKIADIFEERGEKFFRDNEKKFLQELAKNSNTIVSLGGGTMANQYNLKFLKDSGTIIYLKASIDSLYKRLELEKNRPKLKLPEGKFSKEKLTERITELYKAREKFYNQSDFVIETDSASIVSIVDKIAKIIEGRKKIST
jgi:shikimate kinase